MFSKNLRVSYASPYAASTVFTVFDAPLRASAGSAQLTVEPFFLDFGDCRVKAMKRLPFALRNSGNQDVEVSALALVPFSVNNSALAPIATASASDDPSFTMNMDGSEEVDSDDVEMDQFAPSVRTLLRAESARRLEATFRPRGDGQHASTVCVCYTNQFLNVDLFGQGGILRLTSNLGPPTLEQSPNSSHAASAEVLPTASGGAGKSLQPASITLSLTRISEEADASSVPTTPRAGPASFP